MTTWADKHRARIIELREEGRSYREIAETLGDMVNAYVTRSTVAGLISRRRLPVRPKIVVARQRGWRKDVKSLAPKEPKHDPAPWLQPRANYKPSRILAPWR